MSGIRHGGSNDRKFDLPRQETRGTLMRWGVGPGGYDFDIISGVDNHDITLEMWLREPSAAHGQRLSGEQILARKIR